MKRHPAVADCLVVGVPDDRFGEAVTAVVSLRPATDATADELGGALEALVALQAPAQLRRSSPRSLRGPNGKADYKWAKAVAADGVG